MYRSIRIECFRNKEVGLRIAVTATATETGQNTEFSQSLGILTLIFMSFVTVTQVSPRNWVIFASHRTGPEQLRKEALQGKRAVSAEGVRPVVLSRGSGLRQSSSKG